MNEWEMQVLEETSQDFIQECYWYCYILRIEQGWTYPIIAYEER